MGVGTLVALNSPWISTIIIPRKRIREMRSCRRLRITMDRCPVGKAGTGLKLILTLEMLPSTPIPGD